MNTQLRLFIEHAREKGMDHSTIRMLLLSAGWKEKQIAQALSEQGLDMPVPVPPDAGGAREAFFHLVVFTSFYTTAVGVVVLLFNYINRLLPDRALRTWSGADARQLQTIRWWMAALIVAFPVLLWLSRLLLREMAAHPEKLWSAVRRWLSYLTLFAAAVALGVDAITLVYYLLEGEITVRFILKIAVVLLVAGSSFAYLLLSLRVPPGAPVTGRMQRGFAGGATTLVLMSLVWGIVIAGSPGIERLRKFDERRIEALQSIQNELENVCVATIRADGSPGRSLKRSLPGTLDELVKVATSERPEIRDPETREAYSYEAIGETKYRLCATFHFARDEKENVAWNHPAGRHCFERDVLEQ